MKLGKAIRLIRTARSIRQFELAQRLKVTPNYISLIESSKREPSLSFLRKLSIALSVPSALFFILEQGDDSSLNGKKQERLADLLVNLQALQIKESKKQLVK